MFDTYPDNKQRVTRLKQLYDDIDKFITNGISSSDKYGTSIQKLNSSIPDIYNKLKDNNIPFNNIPFNVTGNIIQLTGVIQSIDSQILPFGIFNSLLSGFITLCTGQIYLIFLLRAARTRVIPVERLEGQMQNTATTISVMSTALQYKAAIFAYITGNFAGTLLQGAYDAVQGAVMKGRLQEAIHTAYSLREIVKTGEMQMAKLEDSATSLVRSIEPLTKDVNSSTLEALMEIINDNINQTTKNLQSITPSEVKTQLAILDEARGSWTNEDL
jgi:hypothetical protein